MNENIGSKGKGNDYRRVLKNIERKKMKLREQAKKNRPKKKRVVQITDSNYSFEPDSKKKRRVVLVSPTPPEVVENGTKVVLQNPKPRKKKVISVIDIDQEMKQKEQQPSEQTPVQTKETPSPKNVEQVKPVVSKPSKPVPKKETKPVPVVIPDVAEKENKPIQKDAKPEKQEPLRPKKRRKVGTPLTDRERIENEALVKVLNEKIYDIEYELRDLAYREWVIQKQVDAVQEQQEAEKLAAQLEEILVALQKLLDDLNDNDYLFDQTYLEELGIHLVHKISNREYVGDNRFILYFDQLISEIEKSKDRVEQLKERTEEKGEELGLVEEDYNRYLDEYYNQEKISGMVQDMVQRQEAILRDIDGKLANAVSTSERTHYVMDGISKQTKNLMAGLAVGMLVPGIRGASAVALGVVATVTGIRHLVAPPSHAVHEKTVKVDDYQKIIRKGSMDIGMARALLNENMKYLEDVMEQCEREFSSYPAYDSIAADFEKLQVVLMEQDAYFAKMEDDLYKKENVNKEQLKLVRD